MKKRVLAMIAAAAMLIALVAMLIIPSLTKAPEKAHEVEECFVSWRDPGVLNIDVFYADGTYAGGFLDVETARLTFSDDEVVLAHIEEVAATERNVVWWMDDDRVMVGVGDANEVLLMEEALVKYQDNPAIIAELEALNGVQVEYTYDSSADHDTDQN